MSCLIWWCGVTTDTMGPKKLNLLLFYAITISLYFCGPNCQSSNVGKIWNIFCEVEFTNATWNIFCPHCVLARGAGMQSPNNSKKFAFNRWRCPMQIIAWGWQSILFCSNINDNARNPFFNASTLIFFNDFLIWLGECNACQHTLQCIIYYSHSLYAT